MLSNESHLLWTLFLWHHHLLQQTKKNLLIIIIISITWNCLECQARQGGCGWVSWTIHSHSVPEDPMHCQDASSFSSNLQPVPASPQIGSCWGMISSLLSRLSSHWEARAIFWQRNPHCQAHREEQWILHSCACQFPPSLYVASWGEKMTRGTGLSRSSSRVVSLACKPEQWPANHKGRWWWPWHHRWHSGTHSPWQHSHP